MEIQELHDILKDDLREIKTDVKEIRTSTTDQEIRLQALEQTKRNFVRVMWTFITVTAAQIIISIKSKFGG